MHKYIWIHMYILNKMFRWTLKALFFLQTILFQGTLGNMIYETTHVSLYSLYSVYKKDLIISTCIFLLYIHSTVLNWVYNILYAIVISGNIFPSFSMIMWKQSSLNNILKTFLSMHSCSYELESSCKIIYIKRGLIQ